MPEAASPAGSDRSALGLGRGDLHALYRALCLTRRAEERLEALHEEGHVPGEIHRSLGQEAGAVGVAFALNRADDGTGDVMAPTNRAAGAVFLFGATPLDFFRQYLARESAPSRGRETDVQWVDLPRGIVGPVSPLGTMIEVVAGMALSFRVRGEDRIGVAFCGDGATGTGAWHEGLAFAAAQRCPLLVVVENNHWAFSTPLFKTTRVRSFTEKAAGYGIGATSVDGTDVLAVVDAVREAAARVRAGQGPHLVELRYFRRVTSGEHDPEPYLDPEEVLEWSRKDPLDGFRARLLANDWATRSELDTIDAEVVEACRVAAEQAVAERLPTPSDATDAVYSDVSVARPWTRHPEPDPAKA